MSVAVKYPSCNILLGYEPGLSEVIWPNLFVRGAEEKQIALDIHPSSPWDHENQTFWSLERGTPTQAVPLMKDIKTTNLSGLLETP